MSMKNTTRKLLYSNKSWNIWHRIMSRSNNDIVKHFTIQNFILLEILDRNSEVISCLVVDNIPYNSVELDLFSNFCLVPATLEVVKKNFSWRIGCDRLAIMLFKSILRELQAFFSAIGPKVHEHFIFYYSPDQNRENYTYYLYMLPWTGYPLGWVRKSGLSI